ncbi:MAG TPA: DUF4407 domain-containing protein [Trebonia sp.]|nr:DUF4407 domain-containing protein [Trebonia sp.]
MLAECPTERPKYFGLGAAIFITGAMAGVSLAFALVSALKVPLLGMIPFAIAWGLAIMMLDRLFVTSMRRQRNWAFYILQALPRLAMAVVIGFVISTPFVLRVFQPEIQSQVQSMLAAQRAAYYKGLPKNPIQLEVNSDQATYDRLKLQAASGVAPVVVADDPQIKAWTAQQSHANSQVAYWTTQLNCQLYGGKSGGTSCVQGYGPVGHDDQQKINYWQGQANMYGQEIQQRTTLLEHQDSAGQGAAKQSASSQLSAAHQALLAAQQQLTLQTQNEIGSINDNDGILEQLKALNAITANNASLQDARTLLFLLFLFIDIMPVFVKLLINLSPATPYDQILQDEEATMIQSAENARATRMATRRQLIQSEAAGMRPWLEAMREQVPGLRDNIMRVREELEWDKVRRWRRQAQQDLANGEGLIGTGMRAEPYLGHLPGDRVGRSNIAWPPPGQAPAGQGARGPRLLRGRPPAYSGQGSGQGAARPGWLGGLSSVTARLRMPAGGRPQAQGYYAGDRTPGYYANGGQVPAYAQQPSNGTTRPMQAPESALGPQSGNGAVAWTGQAGGQDFPAAEPIRVRQASSGDTPTTSWDHQAPAQSRATWAQGPAEQETVVRQGTSPWNQAGTWRDSADPEPVTPATEPESPWSPPATEAPQDTTTIMSPWGPPVTEAPEETPAAESPWGPPAAESPWGPPTPPPPAGDGGAPGGQPSGQ